MSLIATAQQTGDFAISFRVMEVLIGVPAVLAGAAFPIISRSARDDRERFEQASGRLYELCLLSGVLMCLLLTLGAPFVIELITGSSDHPASDVLRIQALAMIATFVATAAGYTLLSLRRHRELLLANLCSLVVVAALAFALVPSMGAEGGAIARPSGPIAACSPEPSGTSTVGGAGSAGAGMRSPRSTASCSARASRGLTRPSTRPPTVRSHRRTARLV